MNESSNFDKIFPRKKNLVCYISESPLHNTVPPPFLNKNKNKTILSLTKNLKENDTRVKRTI